MPQLISTLRRPATPPAYTNAAPLSTEDAQALARQWFTSFRPQTPGGDLGGFARPRLIAPPDDLENDEPPPLLEDRPPSWGRREDNIAAAPREWSMQQFICFVYRGSSIWLRVTVAMDEIAEGVTDPYVAVEFVTRLTESDPALRRIGLVIEQELQEGMRREILRAIRHAVNMEVFRE